ncbi:MAG: sigma-70 family RNA polymerase sigma factor [Clostridia bacterium]|nr:sigma-70 family RNA polymerase sigma factor [Clostridia bacterium]
MTNAAATEQLITDNLGLVHACANRFRNRGVEYEDLFQAGCVGLVKAAGGFDAALGYRFSTYAVPAILGEIRRIFRDGGTVKIGRAAKEKARRLLELRETLASETGKEPTVSQIAALAGMDAAEAAVLLSASLPVISLTDDSDEGQTDIPVPAPDEKLTERIDLKNAMTALSEQERRLIELRYYKGLTQTVVAGELGMSQVQVSRKEKAILLKLRQMMS